jgi:hypothetical protein
LTVAVDVRHQSDLHAEMLADDLPRSAG